MTGTDTFRRAPARGLRIAAALALSAAALSGCSSEGKGTPAWTAGGDAGTAAAASPSGPPAGSPPPATSPGPTGSGAAEPGATAPAWKVFTDPAKTVSFELPQDWIAQSVAPEQGAMPGALKIEVKDAAGGYLATLQTGLQPLPAASCAADASRPYVVVNSVPVELPHRGGDGTIDPRVVFRVIQGYKYFGSYGITNLVGGLDGKSCVLQNVVRGPAGKGDYSFGDLTELKAFTPDQKVAPAKAFDTLGQAANYVNEGSEYANVQRMLMSLKIKN
ncbi:hypothetical protein QK292_12905 [Arthrobacter sp. AL08]|uniref:hypothetical protein n=1 Tax=Micrococcaceae TaxID=1268 RepID=UPI00249C7B83|nr:MULTISPECIES: hypothetical protein [Micrococcaceae]MDI3242540.1 hypothetical protein [Arthrobacter sp. AL05]MDI3278464.1 hypothetical protein [Arthrobacter sp. AL08]MDJ0351305.1 hypothetical protein [Pseudarthrobacter sp. PH31-O2]